MAMVPLTPSIKRAAAIEATYLRTCRMRAMREADLRALLTGDPSRAAVWLASAAEHGEAWAQLRLGQMWLDGQGVGPDAEVALSWFARAADAGLAEAMNMVGRCHENGWGTAINPTLAADWYGLAAWAGLDWGQYNLAHMLLDGRGIARDQAQAVVWYRRAAEQGHARAMNLLARCHEEGWGTDPDPRQAALWYRRSAEAGCFRGQFNFATLLVAWGDLGGALAWFARAIDGGGPASGETMRTALLAHPDPRIAEWAKMRSVPR